jgi:hypothetical protein
MKLQYLLEREGVSKTKYRLNTPKSVIVKINSALKSDSLSNKHKKTLSEIRGILVGKYPTKQALENSLKGLEKKVNSLNEAKTSKIKALILAIIVSLTTACNSADVVKKAISPNRFTSIEREITPEEQNIVQVEMDTWREIEENLERIANEQKEEQSNEISRYMQALSDYNPNEEHLQIMVNEAKKRGISPSLALAIVAQESSFRESVVNNRNRNGTNDYGYFQLNSRWHNQHRGNVEEHIKTALDHLKWTIDTENGNIRRALSRYNTGRPDLPIGERYAQRILNKQSNIDAVRIASM